QLVPSSHLLSKADAGTLEFQDISRDHKFIIQLRRRVVAGADGMNDKDGVFALQRDLIKPQRAHQLSAGTLHEFQVIDVINNTAGVGILKVDSGCQLEWLPGHVSSHNVEPSEVFA